MLSRMCRFLTDNATVLCAGVGMGLYRCLHEWPVWFNDAVYQGTVGELFAGTNFFMFVDAGKIVGLVVFAVLCFRFDRRCQNEMLVLGPSILSAACLSVPLLFAQGVSLSAPLVLASLFGVGMATGMLFAQWIEFFGSIPPVRVVQALAFSYVVRFLVLPLFVTPAVATDAGGILGIALVSTVLVGWCSHRVSWEVASERQLDLRASLTMKNLWLLLFVALFAGSYGLGSGVTGLSHAPVETGWGKVLPSLVVMVLTFKMNDRFDRTILYALALPLMTAGLLGVVFLGLPRSFSQVLLSAGFSMFHLLIYVIVCSDAYRSKRSAMAAGVCARVLALVAADAAILAFEGVPLGARGIVVTGAVIASIVVGFAAFLPRLGIEGARSASCDAEDEERRRSDIASAHSLSARETTVFFLLLEGKTATRVSEELFISNGAVRAHCSRIYDKFGVHSRKDFDSLFDRK